MAGERPPHLKKDSRNGTWIYRRTIPPNLRAALGGKREFVRSLGTGTDRFTSKAFRRAYEAARAEAEALLNAAEHPQTALTERDRFGLIRELLLAYEMTDQQAMIDRRNKALPPVPGESSEQWIQRQAIADAQIDVLLLNEVTQRLKLTLTAAQATEILVQFQQHVDL